MKRTGALRFMLAALGAAGCGAMAPTPPPAAIVYVCPDGQSVRASYPDTRTAMIEYRGVTHTLKTAVSADGARYIGDGLQWWTKGMTHGSLAVLAPGETYAAPGRDCVAAPNSTPSAP